MAEPSERDREQAITEAKAWLIKHGFGYYMPTGSGLCPHVSAVMDLMRECREQGRAEEREACAACVPTNWCDSLLTGPNAAIKGCFGSASK